MTPAICDLDILIRARYNPIAVLTFEEERALSAIKLLIDTSDFHNKKTLYTWSRVRGITQRDPDGREIPIDPDSTQVPEAALQFVLDGRKKPEWQNPGGAIIVLCDFYPYLDDPVNVRMVREIAHGLRNTRATLIFLGEAFPDHLSKEVYRLEFPLPGEAELTTIASSLIEQAPITDKAKTALGPDDHQGIVSALLGLGQNEVRNLFNAALIRNHGLDAACIPLLVDGKRKVVGAVPGLTYADPEPVDHLGGYGWLHHLLDDAAASLTPAARAFGVEPKRGVLLVGPPGVGKDLFKKVAAWKLARPLLDLDLGTIMGAGGGVIGTPETGMRRALAMAAVIRGVLGISEFEKALSGMESSGKTDGGTMDRLGGYLLNWLAENTDVYKVATANDVTQLKPELLREGRWEIKFVNVPKPADRPAIFAVHLRKKNRQPDAFDLDALAKAADTFTGAEIKAAVDRGLLRAYRAGKQDVDTGDILAVIPKIVPIARLRKDEIARQLKWIEENGFSSDDEETSDQPDQDQSLFANVEM